MKKTFTLSLFFALFAITDVHSQIITSLVGSGLGTHTGDGGPSTAAEIYAPFGAAVDYRGNVFVSEYANYIRKIDHNGIITTFAGRGTVLGPIGDGGPATAAYLDAITDLHADNMGNLYMADRGLARIRKVNSAGIITTVAGGGLSLANGMPATDADLTSVNGITIDAAGNIYVAMGKFVRKINAAGYITTIAGNGTPGYSGDGNAAVLAQVKGAYDVAVDKAGNVYFTDEYYNVVRKINGAGIITTIAGNASVPSSFGGDGGPATAALMSVPWGMVIDNNDNLFICDRDNYRVRKINTTTGIISTVVGMGWSGFGGDGGDALFAMYGGANIAIDCGGNLFLPGSFNRLRKVTYIHEPYFTTAKDTLNVCINTAANDIDSLMPAADADTLEYLGWSIDVPAMHGTVSGTTFDTFSNRKTITPRGLSYTPATGYAGLDSFTIQVAYCNQIADWKKIYVNVNPLPVVPPIIALYNVCKTDTIIAYNAVAGGVWSTSNTNAQAIGSKIIGKMPGLSDVNYTVTVRGCSTMVSYPIQINDCYAGIQQVAFKDGLNIYPNPATDMLHIDLAAGNADYKIMNVVGDVIKQGILVSGNNSIDIKDMVTGSYLIQVTDAATSMKVTKRIVKQ